MSLDLLIKVPLRQSQTVLSVETKTVIRQVKAAFAVEPFSHFTWTFPRSTSGWVPLTGLVPASLFEDKPDVPRPEENVYKPKNLPEQKWGHVGMDCFTYSRLLVDWIHTADVLRRDQKGSCVAAHLFSWALQAEMRRSTSVGFVALLISVRLFDQQQLLTNHMREKMTVTAKSCPGQKKIK